MLHSTYTCADVDQCGLVSSATEIIFTSAVALF